jgi:hypothetical protein
VKPELVPLSNPLIGRTVRPTNRHYATGIHHDATAQAAGFRGGTIAGSAHLDTFVPLAIELFGDGWFRNGSLSFAFTYATTDGEPTVASVGRVARDGQHDARIETPEGVLIGHGTLGAPGAAGPSQLFRSAPVHDPTNVRILKRIAVGDRIGPAVDVISGADLEDRAANGLITEPIDAYRAGTQSSVWGSQIVPPSAVIDSTNRVISAQLEPLLPKAVGMWSALEVRFLDGPVFAEVPYSIEGSIVALADSPKTEIIWQDFVLYDESDSAPRTAHASRRAVASARVQSRFVKSTSDLWRD